MEAIPSAVAARRRQRTFVPADFDASDWGQIEPLGQQLLDAKLGTADEAEAWVNRLSELYAAIDEYGSRKYIEKSCNTEDEAIKKAFLHFVENIEPKLKPMMFEMKKKYLAADARPTGERYTILERQWAADVELFREENVALQTEETKLVTQYDEICGRMAVEFRGKTYTMQQMAKFQEETDRDTREEAWEATVNRRMEDREAIEDIFDKLLPLRQQIAENAGFDNYRDYTFKALHRFDYTPDDCHRYAKAIEQSVVPVIHQLDKERVEKLGIDSLRPWDASVDVLGRGPLRPFNEDDIDGFVATTKGVFEKLDPTLAEGFDLLRQAGNLDLDSRHGKQPGGYQANLEETGIPFIFMNAAGTQRDVETLLHEGGHAFHTLLSHEEPLAFLRHAPMEFCEVASMSMELLALPYMDDFFEDSSDANRARRHQLEGVAVLAWIATIDQFQHWLYTNPGHTREQRAEKWVEIFDKFGHGTDWSGYEDVKRSLWQRQLHLFHVPFYYIEYGIAQLGALQLWLQSKRDPKAALANYKRALTLGGTKPLPDLFAAAELKFDFSETTVAPLMKAVSDDLATLPA
ncbi:MAG: M3 family oligoendopeptidase [Planctomycetota bacterium]